MAFKFDAEADHVQMYRNIVKKAKELDEDVDRNKLTPDEAFAELQEFISKNAVPAASASVKKAQAEAKKVEAEEKAAAAKVAAAEKKEEKEETRAELRHEQHRPGAR